MGDVQIAVTVVGSSTRSEEKRHHPVRDIDLRILNSADPNSDLRLSTVGTIREAVRGYLEESQVTFDENEVTMEERMVSGFGFDPDTGKRIEELMPYVDWYNNDPSFTTNSDTGIPLHISISGIDNFSLPKYLQKEQEMKTDIVLLLKS